MIERGLITIISRRSVGDTLDALAKAVEANGMVVFARIDHGANAAAVGLPLRPTQLLIFGGPKAGTALMQEDQIVGIDLPWKALAWEDEDGQNWLTYPDAEWLAQQHGLDVSVADAIKAIDAVVAKVVVAAVS